MQISLRYALILKGKWEIIVRNLIALIDNAWVFRTLISMIVMGFILYLSD